VAKLVQRGGDQFTRSGTRSQRLDGYAIPTLLRHHADYVDAFLVAICEGGRISIAGRQALAYTADRLREIAEVLS
jgi:hypothetical protein